jgi:DNA-binding LacI/PurR family transcriptional regulator
LYRVGVVVPHLGRWWSGEVLAGLESVLHPAGCETVVYPVPDADTRAAFFERLPRRSHLLDAVVVVALPLTDAEAALVRSANVPVVTLGVKVRSLTGVFVDERRSAGLAVRHLLDLGHTRIGLVGGDPHEPHGFSAAGQRRGAYRYWLSERGLWPEAALDVPGYWTVRGGAIAAHRLMSLPEPPTAIFAMSDEMAFGVLRALEERGLRVPEDVSVCGFDDHPDAATYALTTVRQPVHDCAARLAAVVVARIRRVRATTRVEQLRPSLPEHLEHDLLQLVVRQTSGPMPARPLGQSLLALK